MVNNSVMFNGNFFPTGGQTMKGLLLQRLLHSNDTNKNLIVKPYETQKFNET